MQNIQPLKSKAEVLFLEMSLYISYEQIADAERSRIIKFCPRSFGHRIWKCQQTAVVQAGITEHQNVFFPARNRCNLKKINLDEAAVQSEMDSCII